MKKEGVGLGNALIIAGFLSAPVIAVVQFAQHEEEIERTASECVARSAEIAGSRGVLHEFPCGGEVARRAFELFGIQYPDRNITPVTTHANIEPK